VGDPWRRWQLSWVLEDNRFGEVKTWEAGERLFPSHFLSIPSQPGGGSSRIELASRGRSCFQCGEHSKGYPLFSPNSPSSGSAVDFTQLFPTSPPETTSQPPPASMTEPQEPSEVPGDGEVQVFPPANSMPARSEAAAVRPVIGISQRVRMNSKEKKDLGTLGMTARSLPLLEFIKRCRLPIGCRCG
jgi:hypothetical protein